MCTREKTPRDAIYMKFKDRKTNLRGQKSKRQFTPEGYQLGSNFLGGENVLYLDLAIVTWVSTLMTRTDILVYCI